MTARIETRATGAGRVAVVGSLNMDLVVRAPRLPLPGG
ncbi:ribokinase, partial [Burkholderia sp. Ac-20353]|nr:ribokinase [Burkholderia sp. Ac-20353]